LYIRKATQYLDARFNKRWRGTRSNEDQALDWPRAWIIDTDGYSIESDEMPASLVNATCELAILAAGGEDLMPDLSNPGTVKSEMRKVGPITTKTEYMGGDSPVKRYRKVDGMLRQLIRPLGEMQRG